LISNASVDGSTGLRIANAAIAAGAGITVKACIGWDNNTGQLKRNSEAHLEPPAEFTCPQSTITTTT